MRKYKIILVCGIVMVVYFLLQKMVSGYETGYNFTTEELRKHIIGAIIMGIFVGIAIKFKWIKTKNILSE